MCWNEQLTLSRTKLCRVRDKVWYIKVEGFEAAHPPHLEPGRACARLCARDKRLEAAPRAEAGLLKPYWTNLHARQQPTVEGPWPRQNRLSEQPEIGQAAPCIQNTLR